MWLLSHSGLTCRLTDCGGEANATLEATPGRLTHGTQGLPRGPVMGRPRPRRPRARPALRAPCMPPDPCETARSPCPCRPAPVQHGPTPNRTDPMPSDTPQPAFVLVRP